MSYSRKKKLESRTQSLNKDKRKCVRKRQNVKYRLVQVRCIVFIFLNHGQYRSATVHSTHLKKQLSI